MSTTVVAATVYVIQRTDGTRLAEAWLSQAAAQTVCNTIPGGGTVLPMPVNDSF